MSRLPIRVRLTLPFAVGMALVLAAMGVVIYVRVGQELLASVDANLNALTAEAVTHADHGRSLIDEDISDGPSIGQIELTSSRAQRSSPSTLPPLLDAAALRTVLGGHRVRETQTVPGLPHRWRIVAVPVRVDGRRAALVVGRSIEARADTLRRLQREFLFAAPAALLLSILGGYGLAVAALRPVELMRRRASAISATTPGARLPVPGTRDEIAALALTLNEMLDRLEGALEHERRFVADASHELRTPLALLRAELELALRKPRPREELEAALASAAEETERLVRLAEELLLIARADQGGVPLRLEAVELGALLEGVSGRFAARADALGREVRVEPGISVIAADPQRLEQALGNLVENALVHGAGTVTLSERRHDRSVELHVTDEGQGFPEGFVSRAFDRFSRAHGARTSPGTGLGLSIVDAIARAHGGEAHVGRSVDGGADAWLRLPASSVLPSAGTLVPPGAHVPG